MDCSCKGKTGCEEEGKMTFWVVCVAEVRASMRLMCCSPTPPAQQPAPVWPWLPLVSSRAGTRLACANARARSDRCPDSKQSSKHSAAERRDFATQLVSSLDTTHTCACACVLRWEPHRFSRHGTVEWSRRQERRIGLANSTRASGGRASTLD